MGPEGSVSALINGLANNGPWACVAGLLIWYLIKSSIAKDQMVYTTLVEFRQAIDKLTSAVERLEATSRTRERR